MKNKKEHLKPAFILCGIVGVVIIIIFIAAGNVNRNVANNLKGSVLYTENAMVKEYNFDTASAATIGEGANGHYVSDGIIFNSDDKIYINSKGENKVLYSLPSGSCFTALTAADNTVAAVYREDNRYNLIVYDIAKNTSDIILTSDEEIMSVCFGADTDLYYSAVSGKNSIVNKIATGGGSATQLLKGSDERIEYINYVNKMLLMCENKNGNTVVSRFSTKTSKAVELKFSSGEYNCVAVTPVYDEEYIVSSDKGGDTDRLYVCNGSNMVEIEDIKADGDCVVSDYRREN